MQKLKNRLQKDMGKSIKAKIRGLGNFYASGLERLEIWIHKNDAGELPYVEGKRVPVTVQFLQDIYEGGIRATSNHKYIWICPDLRESNGEKTNLSIVLKKYKMKKNDEIYLSINNRVITIKNGVF